MVFFAAPTEDEVDDERDLNDQNNPDEFDMENYKGLEIRTMNPCTYSLRKRLNIVIYNICKFSIVIESSYKNLVWGEQGFINIFNIKPKS